MFVFCISPYQLRGSFIHTFICFCIAAGKFQEIPRDHSRQHWTKMKKIKHFQSKIYQTYCCKMRQSQEDFHVEIGNIKEFSQTDLQLLVVVIKILQLFFLFLHIAVTQKVFRNPQGMQIETIQVSQSKWKHIRKISHTQHFYN